MVTKSSSIEKALKIAIDSGNSISDISENWSEVNQVVYMSKELTNSIREKIKSQVPLLDYWSIERTPHNPAEEGFICKLFKIAISFPKK